MFGKFSDNVRRRFGGFCIDHVALNTGKVHREHRECIQHVGDNKRPAVVFFQTIHVVVKGVEAASGEQARLPPPPPNIFRQRWARAMNSAEPTRTEPTGAPSPLEKQIEPSHNAHTCELRPRRWPARR